MDPATVPNVVSQVEPIIASKSGTAMWIALLIFLIPVLDNLLAENKFPYGMVTSTRVRLALIAAGASVVSALQLVQNGTSWPVALSTGGFAVVVAVLRNGTTLFPQKDDGTPGSVKASKIPPGAGSLLALVFFVVVFVACMKGSNPATSPTVQADAAALAKCAGPKLLEGSTPEQAAIECGASELTLIEAIASNLLAARKMMAACAPAGGNIAPSPGPTSSAR